MRVHQIVLREDEEFITLNTALKLAGVISTGGMAKIYLKTNDVLVNKEKEDRRGRKLYRGDVVENSDTKIEIK